MSTVLPYKSVAAALLFCVVLGPVGLLYSSFVGGIIMIVLGIVVVRAKLIAPIVLLWILCAIWGVGATNRYNKKILQTVKQ